MGATDALERTEKCLSEPFRNLLGILWETSRRWPVFVDLNGPRNGLYRVQTRSDAFVEAQIDSGELLILGAFEGCERDVLLSSRKLPRTQMRP